MPDPLPPTKPEKDPEAAPTLAGVDPVPTPRTAPTSRFFGRYTLLDEIGRGGMGVVWKAWDNQLKRAVALKQILPGSNSSWEDVERFLREAQLAARLRHPHIVSVYDAGSFEGQSYYTADFIEGRPLSELMKRPLAPHDVARWIQSMAEALAYAHGHGVVHRDVKPGNILIGADGQAYLTDFGLAKQLRASGAEPAAALTLPGAVLGTPQYMSPEQASGEADVGPAGDQFSLAVVLYECLTGRRAFDGRTPFEIACEVMSREPDTPRSVRPQIHPDLETIVMKCLEKRPDRRYRGMDEVASDLGRYLRGEAIQARPVSTVVRIARKVREHRGAIGVGLAAVLVLGIAAYALVAHLRRGRHFEAALAEARKARAAGQVRDARDAYERARYIDDANAEVRDGIAWADSSLAGAEKEARWKEEGLRKSSLVANIVARWLALKDVMVQIQRVALDPTLSAEVKRTRAAESWADVESFLGATADDPTSRATALALAGWAKVLSGDKAGGIAWMDEARALDPDVPYGAMMKATARLLEFMQQDLPRAQQGGGEAAIEEFFKARERVHVDVDPLLDEVHKASVWGGDLAQQVETMLKMADAMATGRLSEADELIATIQVIPGMQPMTGYMSRLRGEIHQRNGDAKGAIAFFTETIHVNPFIPGVYADRAWARYSNGDAKGAIEDYTESLRLRPGDLQALLDRARIYGEEGEHAKALADLDAAVRLAPELSSTRLARAAARQRAGDAKGAVEEIEPIARAAPGNADAWRQLGAAKQAAGDLEGAVAAWDHVIDLDPKDATSYCARGFARKLKGDVGAAIGDYDRAIALKPVYPEALNNRGWAKFAKEDLHGAIADFGEAIRLKPDHVEALGGRGRAKELEGDLEGAITDYDRALQLAPEGWPHRGRVETLRAEAVRKRDSAEKR